MEIRWKTCFKVASCLFLLYLCINYLDLMQGFLLKAVGAAVPLLIGGAIAYVVNIIMASYERHYFPMSKNKAVVFTRRPICMLAAFCTVIAIIVVIVSLILPEFLSCIQLLLSQIPDALKKLVDFMEKMGVVPEKILIELSNLDWQAKIGDIIDMVSAYFGNVMNMIFMVITAFFSGVVVAILSIIFAIYLLASKEKLHDRLNDIIDSYFKPKICEKIRYFSAIINDCFHKFIVGQTTEAVILGVLCTVGMLVLRLPYATMIGALVGFTAIVPVVGAFAGAIVGAFMISTVSMVEAVIFIVFIVILQQLEGNLIYPKVVGSSLGLPSMVILATVTVGGGVFGVLGMVLGVPLVSAAYKIITADVKNKTAKRLAAQEKSEENQEHDETAHA
ncbi:MAG: AI-2E family transporter [Clostridia bacterium]|nr:AI-2E family transporter [Clostridia bacterium]